MYYIIRDYDNSTIFNLLLGTVQGFILSPILCELFVTPLVDLEPMLAFTDGSCISRAENLIPTLIKDMEKSFEVIAKQLRKLGLKVNQSNTELCFYYKNDKAKISIKLNDVVIFSSNVIMCWEHCLTPNFNDLIMSHTAILQGQFQVKARDKTYNFCHFFNKL
jgi:hypothetical protein